MKNKSLHSVQLAGSLLTLTGAVLQLFELEFSKYVFAIGALILIVVYFIYTLRAKNEPNRIQRQHRLMLFATLFLGVGAYLMYTNKDTWVVMVLIYALISVFLSFRKVEKQTE